MTMVKLTVDFDDEAKVWYVKTSDLSGVHAEGETLDGLCGKLPAIVSDLVESNQDRKPGTCYCSFCSKSQHQVPKLIAGPAVFICNECVSLCSEIVEEKLNTTQIQLARSSSKSSSSCAPMWRDCMMVWPELKKRSAG